MFITRSPSLDAVFEVLRSFLTDILPEGVGVYQGQDNRTAQPTETDFLVMWPILKTRLATNLNDVADSVFTGSLSGNVLTITAVDSRFEKPLTVNSVLLGVDILPSTVVAALGTGTGGIGTYIVSKPQTLSSRTIAAGQELVESGFELTVQVDIHGPNAHDNAASVGVLFFDERATSKFDELSSGRIAPLFADDARQMPFQNDQQQVEDRWMVDLHMQVNYLLVLPQEFADSIEPTTVSVEAIPNP